jgi:hypothetical protein
MRPRGVRDEAFAKAAMHRLAEAAEWNHGSHLFSED